MKAPTIILSLLVLGLAFALYKRHSAAGKELGTFVKGQHSLSNQVAELRTRLALEHGTAAHSESNLNFALNRRTAELIVASNRLVQANLLLKTAQAQGEAAQAELQSKAARLALLENERDDLKRQMAVVPTQKKLLDEAAHKVSNLTTDCQLHLLELRRLQVEKSELMSKLDDVSFLRIQLARAEEDAELQQRLLKAGRSASLNRKARLELQQDGTVRPLLPVPGTQAQK